MWRRRLRWLMIGLAVVFLATVVLALWPWSQDDRVTRENFDRLKEGMTRAEVQAILGPPGDYRTGDTDLDLFGPTGFGQRGNSRPRNWHGDTARITVGFDPSERLFAALYTPMRRSKNPVENVFFRAFRLYHRWFPRRTASA